jgi:protein SCO1/2
MPAWRRLLFCLFCALASAAWAAPRLGGDFVLHDSRGSEVSLASLRGKVVLLFFGFTSCPEMCPTELAQFKHLLARLSGEQRGRVQALFVSVDPKRDTPELLHAYVSHFSPQILALTGSEEEVRRVAGQYGASFRYVPNGSDYTVDHTVNTYVIDPRGSLVRILPYGTPGSEMLRVVQTYLLD